MGWSRARACPLRPQRNVLYKCKFPSEPAARSFNKLPVWRCQSDSPHSVSLLSVRGALGGQPGRCGLAGAGGPTQRAHPGAPAQVPPPCAFLVGGAGQMGWGSKGLHLGPHTCSGPQGLPLPPTPMGAPLGSLEHHEVHRTPPSAGSHSAREPAEAQSQPCDGWPALEEGRAVRPPQPGAQRGCDATGAACPLPPPCVLPPASGVCRPHLQGVRRFPGRLTVRALAWGLWRERASRPGASAEAPRPAPPGTGAEMAPGRVQAGPPQTAPGDPTRSRGATRPDSCPPLQPTPPPAAPARGPPQVSALSGISHECISPLALPLGAATLRTTQVAAVRTKCTLFLPRATHGVQGRGRRAQWRG